MRVYEMAGYDPAEWYELVRVEFLECWACGEGCWAMPDGWGAPWSIERAHIVSKPRVEDRRVIVMLCSACHKAQHGEVLPGFERPALTVGQMLWLKRERDRQWYDPVFLAKHCVGRLPELERLTHGTRR